MHPLGTYIAVSTASTTVPARASTASGMDAAAVAQTREMPGVSITLSGKSIMLSRLFHIADANAQPAVISGSTGFTHASLSQNPVDFLTANDRSLVADMYAYAQQQGSDLVHVDTLAITLGTYRQFDNGASLSGFNEGQFDSEGHQLSSSYSPSDTKTANRILVGDAITSSRLDPGFLRFILQPTHALSNMANVDFMEQMVTRFSDKGTEAMPLDNRFASFRRADSAVSNVVISASSEVVHKAPETQIANINGRWFILDPAILNDPAALKATGLDRSQLADAKRNEGVVALALLDADPEKSNGVAAKLLDLLGLHRQPAVL